MTLENLSSIGRLKPHSPARVEIQRLLAAAEASLQDARRDQISASSRFDLAYKSLMQSALAALMAKVPPISRHGNVNEIIDKFGGADQLRSAVNQLQTLLYAA